MILFSEEGTFYCVDEENTTALKENLEKSAKT